MSMTYTRTKEAIAMLRNTQDLEAADRAHVFHPSTNLKAHAHGEAPCRIVEGGEGVWITDREGRRSLDAFAGLYCVNVGYGRKEIADAVYRQMQELAYYHAYVGHSSEPTIELSRRIIELAPAGMSRVYYGLSGSDANETQIKLVWYYNNVLGRPEKKKIISRIKGYHGVTVASGSLTGLPTVHTDFDLPIKNILHTSCPHYYRFAAEGESEEQFSDRMARDLEEIILREGPDTVAAFIAEPVMGAGGVILPPKGYFERIEKLLDRYDIRFIADEVICGFGRTGNWFGTETFKLNPDSVSLAKAITSAYFPLGAISIEEDLYQAMLEESKKIGTFGHGYTYTAHPVAAAVALKTIEIYQRDRIVDHVRKVAPTFQARFARLADHPLVGEVRGIGLIGAAELVAEKRTRRPFDPKHLVGFQFVQLAQKQGLICRMLGDAVALCPPLVINDGEIDEMFDMYERALADTEVWVAKEGLRNA
jgi:4-aminobutyrate--pyruvate transaminase